MSTEKITEDEEPEIVSHWEKRVESRLENIENLLTQALQKGKSKSEKKPTTSIVPSLVRQCLDWFNSFDVDKFISLAKERDLIGDEAFSDADLTYIYSVLPNWDSPLLLETDEYEEMVKKLCESLKITPARFEELKAFSESTLELARKKVKETQSSEIEVSEASEEE